MSHTSETMGKSPFLPQKLQGQHTECNLTKSCCFPDESTIALALCKFCTMVLKHEYSWFNFKRD